MARVNYREVANRFFYIDAELEGRFLGSAFGLPGTEDFFRVECYLWWEHPLYLAKPYAEVTTRLFTLPPEAFKTVTVYPKGVRKMHLSARKYVNAWWFTQEHPVLWQYEVPAGIMCNVPLSLEQWMQVVEALHRRKIGPPHEETEQYIARATRRVYRDGKNAPFTLGPFPRPLYIALREILTERNIPQAHDFPPENIEQLKLPVVMWINDWDYIIADDFEIDMPEFEHKPEWFKPRD